MDIADHIDALRREGDLLGDAASVAGPDAAVPTCPEWRVRDLVHHMSTVHRWATANVADPAPTPADADAAVERGGGYPDDADLVDWYRSGHAALVAVLEDAPRDLECWTFLAAPTPLAFWARRQAHETTMHRVDAESAVTGGTITPVAAELAADGIDELLTLFIRRPIRGLPTDETRTLAVRCTDLDRGWVITATPESVTTVASVGGAAGHPAADGIVGGTASDLYLWLWNRRDLDGLDVSGDRAVVERWRDDVRVRWGG